MGLVRIVNSTYNEVDRNLQILEGEDMITQQYFGRKRIIRLNFENKKTQLLLEAIRILETPADHSNNPKVISQMPSGNDRHSKNTEHVRKKIHN